MQRLPFTIILLTRQKDAQQLYENNPWIIFWTLLRKCFISLFSNMATVSKLQNFLIFEFSTLEINSRPSKLYVSQKNSFHERKSVKSCSQKNKSTVNFDRHSIWGHQNGLIRTRILHLKKGQCPRYENPNPYVVQYISNGRNGDYFSCYSYFFSVYMIHRYSDKIVAKISVSRDNYSIYTAINQLFLTFLTTDKE